MNRKIESTKLWGYDVLDEETHEKDMAIKVLDEPILVGLYVLKYDTQEMHERRSILAIYNDLSRH